MPTVDEFGEVVYTADEVEAARVAAIFEGPEANPGVTDLYNTNEAVSATDDFDDLSKSNTTTQAENEQIYDPTYGGVLPNPAPGINSAITNAIQNAAVAGVNAAVNTASQIALNQVNRLLGSLQTAGGGTPGFSGTSVLSDIQTKSQILNLLKISSAAQSYQTTLPNPLHGYDSYTYNISLHLLSEAEYNRIMNNPGTSYIPQNVLVASAGKYGAKFIRNPNFTEDFFFEELRTHSVINTTIQNRNSNLYECSFTIIEPNGFTFINRLVEAVRGVGGKNYLRQPYLLQIDFYGYENGEITANPLPGMTKYIPIALTSMKTRVTNKGTEYRIDALPYNHQALTQMHVVSPATFQVKAKTVADMFGSGIPSNQLTNAFAQAQREQAIIDDLEREIRTNPNLDARDLRLLQQKLATASKPTGIFQVSGFCDALNAWYVGLRDVNKKILVANTYKVEFHPDIGDRAIFPPGAAPNNLASTPAGGATTQQGQNATRAAGGLANGQIEWNSGLFNIPMGTQIDKLIDYTIRNSEYIREQLASNESGMTNDFTKIQTKLGKPLRWYRIIPRIKIKQYDEARRQYGFDIVYYVKPWTVNTKDPAALQGRVPGFVKKYNWIYTGQNTDVLDLSLDFDMMYYQQLTAYSSSKRDGETGENIGVSNTTNPNLTNQGPTLVAQDTVQQVPINYVAFDYRTQTRTGPYPGAAATGGDIQRDITASSRGDMINIKMRIIGDPHFIKQDDIFYGQSLELSPTQLTPNGSLYTDDGELYVYLDFQSPDDYDESIGLAVPGLGFYSYNLFKGIYKIIKIESEFSKGKFEQVLDLYRLPISDENRNQITNAFSRAESYLNYGLGQLAALPYARFTGPRILVNNVGNGGTGVINAVLGAAGSGGGGLEGLLSSVASQIGSQVLGQIQGKVLEEIKTAVGNFVDSLSPFGGLTPPAYDDTIPNLDGIGILGGPSDIEILSNNLELDGSLEVIPYDDTIPDLDGIGIEGAADIDIAGNTESLGDWTDF